MNEIISHMLALETSWTMLQAGKKKKTKNSSQLWISSQRHVYGISLNQLGSLVGTTKH
jgi:hypothetical protein